MGRKGRPKIDPGTCNVCSAPCSSCMHHIASFTGSKSDESSDENSHGVVASLCSFNTASEASNLVNSNHDTLSEIAESKEIIRSSGTILEGARKDQDSTKVDSCSVLPKEMKSQSSHSLLSDHQARNILGQEIVKENSGADNNKVKKTILLESSMHPNQSGKVEKSGEISEPEESHTSAMSENESADSEMLELDVKVCDICGDAGREDLLAFCSRCNDGAEHTYCMRVMLNKVLDVGWLCEECKSAEEAEKQKLELELKHAEAKRKRETEVNLNTQNSSKRQIDKFEAEPDAKRQAVETSTMSPKKSVFPRLTTFSRETSFKSLEKTTRKLAHHTSFNSHSSVDTESTRSTDSQLQSANGFFLKSNSFNSSSSRPKVRPVDDVILSQPKTVKENASLDVKDGLSRNIAKSMSSRCLDVGSSGCNDSKVKGCKQLKDRSTEANPLTSTLSQKLISRGSSSISYANSARDLKGLQPDGKQSNLIKQARQLSRNRVEDIVASVGNTSTNENCSSSGQISSEAVCKDELATVDGLPRSREIREAGEKSKDSVGNRQMSDLLSGLKSLPSQKGQNAEPTDIACASKSNFSTTRNIREDNNNGNRLRAAVDAALRKKPSFGKKRGLEQSDLPSVSNVDSICDKAFQNFPSKVPVIRDWPVLLQGFHGGHPNVRTDRQTIPVNGKQSTLAGADAMATSQSVETEVHFPTVKPPVRDLTVPAPKPTVLSTTSAIPEHEYIWQGDLEVQKRSITAMYSGIQAYLSTLASPKVVEVVNQFPVKIYLNEVPRLSIWPTQFQDIGAKEDHVALFFFAKDIESYEKNYKPLVDNMILRDLALTGNLEGVELLIFASNQLPQNCQRWNMLYFLWGVFRGKKENSSNPLQNTPLPASCVLSNTRKPFSASEGFCPDNPSNRDSLIGHASSRMPSCMKKKNAKEDEVGSAIDKENPLSTIEENEGEIGVNPHLTEPPRTLNKELCPVNEKLKTGSGLETEHSISRSDTFGNESASRKSDATKRIVLPLDLNDGKEEDDEMVENNPRPPGNDNNQPRLLSIVPNLELGLGEEKTTTTGAVLPFGARTTSIEEQDQIGNHEDSVASLSLSLSFSSSEKEQQQNERSMSGLEPKNQNVNTLFLFRDFPDKSS